MPKSLADPSILRHSGIYGAADVAVLNTVQPVHSTKYVHIKSTTVYAPRRNWDSPQPPARRLVCPLPSVSGGEGNTRWRKRGWESPISDEGHTLWYSLYVRTLWYIGKKQKIPLLINDSGQ
jgi:hypothetical protein